jgi:structural maintenance of chromosome 1
LSTDRLVINNFKSYGGEHVVGPFKPFTAVIGPNGSGKSNIMDAISFVLGVQSNKLRGDKLSDLIHSRETFDVEKVKAGERADDKERATRSAYVEIVYRTHKDAAHAECRELLFRRGLNPKGVSTFYFNGRVVKWDRYNDELAKIGVITRARNFLVFQGDVESVGNASQRNGNCVMQRNDLRRCAA